MSIDRSSDRSKLYLVTGMASSTLIEYLLFEGYNYQDVYYFLFEQHETLKDTYPFIQKVIENLFIIYKQQYHITPNTHQFKELVDHSEEIEKNYVHIYEYQQTQILNVCSYYQNNKKSLNLKAITSNSVTSVPDKQTTLKPKISLQLKKKI